MIRSLSATVKAGALLVLVVAGLFYSGLGLRSDPQSAEAAFLNEVKILLASQSQAGCCFGVGFGLATAISDDTAVVGAFNESTGDNELGAAYVFERNQGGSDNWGEFKKLVASDGVAADRFGFIVAIDGDTIVVGRQTGVGEGGAYVFGRDEGGADNWGEVKKLTSLDLAASQKFGWSVAISRDTVAVGAPHHDGEGPKALHIYSGVTRVVQIIGVKSRCSQPQMLQPTTSLDRTQL